jgi:hypothetical protein
MAPSSIDIVDLSPANERDHFQPVASLQQLLGMPRSRDELQVHFHGHMPRLDFELLEQTGHGSALRHHSRLAVEEDFHVRKGLNVVS